MSQTFRRLLPTVNRILVRRAEPVTKTASGIILNTDENPNTAEVVEVGPGEFDRNGNRIPLEVQVGDTVLLPDFGGEKVTLEGGDYYLYRDTDIRGILRGD